MRAFRKYLFVALLSARSNFAYMAEAFSRIVFLGIILYIFTNLWQIVFKYSGQSRLFDLSLQQMIWYLTVTEAIALSASRVTATVDLDVRSGALVSYLQRPISYPLYSLATNLGERGVRMLANLLVGSLVASLLVGIPHLSAQGILFFTLAVPMALIVDFLGRFLVGLGAFWLEDTEGISIIYTRVTMMLGGMLFPISLYPEPFRQVVEWMPFASVLYGPAKMFVAPSNEEFVSVILHQFLGVAFFAVIVWLVYGKASKRVFVNGG